jgi:AraC family L-rhamnose operon regulatory protein RhaS
MVAEPDHGILTPRRRACWPKTGWHAYQGKDCLIPELAMVGWARFRVATHGIISPHTHADTYEFHYLVGGSVQWWVEESVHEVGPGQVFFTRPGERHGGVNAVMHPCELYWLQLDATVAKRFGADALIQAAEGISLRSFHGSPAIGDRFDELLREQATRGPLATVAARTALHSLLLAIVRDHDAELATVKARPAGTSPEVARAMRWIDEHAIEGYDIDDMAAVAGLRVNQLHERFAREVGFSPAEYRLRLRMRQAEQQLRDGGRSIGDIGLDLGFSSSQYFATAFKKHAGLTPREYRRRAMADQQPSPRSVKR